MSKTVANDDQKPGAQQSPEQHVADETAMAHGRLRVQFERIEQALQRGELQKGAHLLSDLIAQTREHFLKTEATAPGAGQGPSHDVMMERARRLKARCLNSPDNADMQHNIGSELVLLLSDLVESDIRISGRVSGRLSGRVANTSIPDAD